MCCCFLQGCLSSVPLVARQEPPSLSSFHLQPLCRAFPQEQTWTVTCSGLLSSQTLTCYISFSFALSVIHCHTALSVRFIYYFHFLAFLRSAPPVGRAVGYAEGLSFPPSSKAAALSACLCLLYHLRSSNVMA